MVRDGVVPRIRTLTLKQRIVKYNSKVDRTIGKDLRLRNIRTFSYGKFLHLYYICYIKHFEEMRVNLS